MTKILVVDDSATQRGIYADVLKEKGYDVVEAKDGKEGLVKARTESPDIVVTDISMPNMGGLEMIEILKKGEVTKYIPIICISATFEDMQTKIKALEKAGAEEYFYGSQSIEEFMLKVGVILRIRKIYQELLEKNAQLKQFNDVVIKRELRVIELKEKIDELEAEIKKCRQQK
ncbi:MAG: response regulator [Candidatus Omnitrophica bacterium]|nr:response regulator [Candidatus Omnitrophota bacterium]